MTARAVAIGVVCILLDVYWNSANFLWWLGAPETVSLYYNVVCTLLVLAFLNLLVRRLRPPWALTRGEMTVIYVMMAIAVGISGHDMMQCLIPVISHPFWFASPENGWQALFLSRVPRWLTVSDEVSLRGFMDGDASIYMPRNFHPWLPPVLAWTGFMLALVFVMLCIGTLFRRNWVDRAKLSYPIVRLPVDMCDPDTPIWRSKVLWVGFALAAAVDILNGLNFLYPSFPSLGGKLYDVVQHFPSRPWSAIGWTPTALYPFAVGLGWLIPLDLSFSCWFFYLFWKVERIAAALTGWADKPDFPYVSEQCFGGYVGLALACAWLWRADLRRIIGRLRRGLDAEDADEPMPYAWAVIGIVVGTLACLLFTNAMGLSIGLGLVYFAIYWSISLAVSRMRAELGTPVHDLHFIGPDEMIARTLGTRRIATPNMVSLTLLFAFNRAYRSHPMPNQVEGMKMADEAGVSQRRLSLAMMLAALVGILGTFWAFLSQSYRLGAIARNVPTILSIGGEPWRRLQSWMTNPRQPQPASPIAAGVGMVFTLTLMALRTKYAWWPFHPAGYAISGSWSMNVVWLSLLVAWLTKAIVLRYAGTNAYRVCTPFFYGLVLGEYVVGAVWNFYGIIWHRETYKFLH